MSALDDQRKHLGMSQKHVAYLLGTRQSNVSAYAAGTLAPGSLVETRLAAFLDLHVTTAHKGSWLGTVPSHAVELRDLLAAHGGVGQEETRSPEVDLVILRHIIGMNDAFMQVDDIRDQAMFLAPPSSTGVRAVDALLAGMAVHWSRVAGLARAPLWTREPHLFLENPWWVGLSTSMTMLRSTAIVNGIPSLRARGVFLDRAALASV